MSRTEPCGPSASVNRVVRSRKIEKSGRDRLGAKPGNPSTYPLHQKKVWKGCCDSPSRLGSGRNVARRLQQVNPLGDAQQCDQNREHWPRGKTAWHTNIRTQPQSADSQVESLKNNKNHVKRQPRHHTIAASSSRDGGERWWVFRTLRKHARGINRRLKSPSRGREEWRGPEGRVWEEWGDSERRGGKRLALPQIYIGANILSGYYDDTIPSHYHIGGSFKLVATRTAADPLLYQDSL